MAHPSLCPACGAAVSGFDQYCGVCCQLLAHLEWRAPGEERWHDHDGFLTVRDGSSAATLLVRNRGVVPAALALRREDIFQLPRWIDREKLGLPRYAVPADAGSETKVEIPLLAGPLQSLFGPAGAVEKGDEEREAHLRFLTNAIERDGDSWTSRPFQVTLLAAREPWVSPAASIYRFLPYECLRGEGIEHHVTLRNETADTLELQSAQVRDDPAPCPPGLERVAASAVVHLALDQPAEIAPGTAWEGAVGLRLTEHVASGAIGWFASLVELQVARRGGDSKTVRCRVEGRVGRGPNLQALGAKSLEVGADELSIDHSFAIENPGQLPVQVLAVEVLRQLSDRAETVAERDWLSLQGVARGDVLAPGATCTVKVLLAPDRRPRDEFQDEESERTIRIRHDGGAGALAHLDLTVIARFGKAQPITVGIDFGTTNSVVCIRNGTYSCPLPIEANPDRASIRSLMYFNAEAPTGGGEFLFGDDAKNWGAVRPDHLVRSIKMVVARDPRQLWVFHRTTANGRGERVPRKSSELLNLFIAELKARAESGLRRLGRDDQRHLGWNNETTPTLDRAVFSHPVNITVPAQVALMEAAHRAGINAELSPVATFFDASCVDEATAAVLAYVEMRMRGGVASTAPTDRECVVCIDIGGGTTDVAAVEVLGLRARQEGSPEKVTVNLWAKEGDAFGGNDIDELLAVEMVRQVGRLAAERDAPVIEDQVVGAVQARSYTAFENDFKVRYGDSGKVGGALWEIYDTASKLLEKAEEAKREISTAATGAKREFRWSLTASGWPRQAHGAAAGDTAPFEVVLRRADFERQVKAQVRQRLRLVTNVISNASWKPSDVTTLLFTGQTCRMAVIRQEIVNHVKKLRGDAAPALLLVEPGQGGLDPKTCVAQGASLWAASRRQARSWLTVQNPYLKALSFDLQVDDGSTQPVPIPGLRRGLPLPIEIDLPVEPGGDSISLLRDGNPYVSFLLPALPAATPDKVKLRIESLTEYFIVVNGATYRGTLCT